MSNDTHILLVYYSLTGHTEYVAKLIARAVGCEIERIEPLIPYKHSKELIRRRLRIEPKPEIRILTHDITHYGTIILGMPVWDNDLPGPVITFLEKVDWRGIRVHPFFATGGVYISVYARLKARCKGAAFTAPLYLIYDSDNELVGIKE